MDHKHWLALAICAALTGCSSSPTTVIDNNATVAQASSSSAPVHISRADIDKIVDRHTRAFMLLQPALATALNLDVAVGGDHHRRLPDYSRVGMAKVQQTMAKAAAELALIDLDQLSDQDRLHVEVNRVIDEYYVGDLDFGAGYIDTWGGHFPFIVNQINGPLIDIATVLQDQHQVHSRQDADHYLARLDAFAVMISQVLDKVKSDEKRGVILPKNLFAKTLGYLSGVSHTLAGEHALVTTFVARLNAVDSIDGKMRQQYVEAATKLVEDKILPGYRQVLAFMTEQQRRAPQQDGIWAQPGGAGYYKHAVLNLGDSTLSPAVIHQTGLDEVARITGQMDQILRANGKTQGTVGQRMMALNSEARFIYPDTDQGREDLLASLRGQVDEMMKKAPQLFATLPKQQVVVKRVPKAIEQGASGGYYTPPALDGSRPGEYYINLRDMESNPSFGLKTLTYHEAAPGHHFQIALNMEQKGLGIMRQNGQFNAYVEGWALYSELLAKEMNLYEGDPWGDLGRLQAELYRAARLVVDTGLHYKQWSREKTVEYFYQATGTSRNDAENAINRYMAWPGQALGYKLGMMKIIELREYAKDKLGERFDIKVFHDLVLLPGARPLPLLERDVKQWLSGNK